MDDEAVVKSGLGGFEAGVEPGGAGDMEGDLGANLAAAPGEIADPQVGMVDLLEIVLERRFMRFKVGQSKADRQGPGLIFFAVIQCISEVRAKLGIADLNGPEFAARQIKSGGGF